MKTLHRRTRWAPLLTLAGIVAACQPVVTPETAPVAAAPAPAPAESQDTCDDSAITLLDRGGAGIHGAIVADTLHMGGAKAPAACSAPVNQPLAGLPDDRTAQAQQSRYYLIVINYPGGNRLYIVTRRGDGTTCVVDLNDECIAQVTDLPDDFDLEDLPDDVAPTIPAGRPAPGAPEEPAAPDEPVTPNEPGAPAAPGATVTLPGAAGSPQPRDGATSVTVDGPLLSWAAGARATSYDLYWGIGKNLAADADLGTPIRTTTPAVTIRRPGATAAERTLAGETTYYWRVDAKNDAGVTKGGVWSFTTGEAPPAPAEETPPATGPLPEAASNPQPRDGATGVRVKQPLLSWDAPPQPPPPEGDVPFTEHKAHLLYWGTARNLDVKANWATKFQPTRQFVNSTVLERDGLTRPTRARLRLAGETTYYWRIDTVNEHGVTKGPVWSFTTEAAQPGVGIGATILLSAPLSEGSHELNANLETDVVVHRYGHSVRLTEEPRAEWTLRVGIAATDVTATEFDDYWISAHKDDHRLAENRAEPRYSVPKQRILTFRNGSTSETIWIYIVGDRDKEPNETFQIWIAPLDGMTCGLGAPSTRLSGGGRGACVQTFTIVDDD